MRKTPAREFKLSKKAADVDYYNPKRRLRSRPSCSRGIKLDTMDRGWIFVHIRALI